jgi:hypothetical protein
MAIIRKFDRTRSFNSFPDSNTEHGFFPGVRMYPANAAFAFQGNKIDIR